jgi:hypothetical protein
MVLSWKEKRKIFFCRTIRQGFYTMSNKRKTNGNGKAAHIATLVSKRNWPKIRQLAASGVQEAVEILRQREGAKAKEVKE